MFFWCTVGLGKWIILKQGNDIEKQRSAFYVLAEKMRLIGEVHVRYRELVLSDIEASGTFADMRTYAYGAKQKYSLKSFRL